MRVRLGTSLPRRSATTSVRGQQGFTLLEVMCAFAILAMITGFMASSWSSNMDKAGRSLVKRELREAADTCFRRILFEEEEHSNGLEVNLEDFYGDWAGFKGAEREKWRRYVLVLEKKSKLAVGTSQDGDVDSLFGETGENTSTGSSSSSDSESEEEGPGIKLTEVTIRIYYADEMQGEPLITLSRLVRPLNQDDV